MSKPNVTVVWRIPGLSVLVSGAVLFSSQLAVAQFSQQTKLVGTMGGDAQQGGSVSLSVDGNTAIVGGNADNGYIGAAWVYTRSGINWTQQSKLVDTGAIGAAGQGTSVSLSCEGDTAIVGGPGWPGDLGAAWVYTRSGINWTQQAKLVDTGAIGGNQGSSVSLSRDGKTAIVGGNGDNNGIGAAWVWTRSGTTWTQQKLVGTGAIGAAGQGWSVSLSSDGNTAIVGGYGDNNGIGAAWVYARSGGGWTQQAKLVDTGAIGGNQGSSVSLSSDGNTAIIGGPNDNNGIGAAWVWTRSGTTWTQQDKLVGMGAIGAASQGTSVSLSSDGNTAIVGGPVDNGVIGAAWVYTRSGTTWTQLEKLVGTGVIGGFAYQGASVSLSCDGNTAIVGGPADNPIVGIVGAAWVYVKEPPPPTYPNYQLVLGDVAIDPMALILQTAQYLAWLEIHHPRIDKVEIQQVLQSMTPEEQKAALDRATTMANYAKAVEKMFRFRTPEKQKAALNRARTLANYAKAVEEAFATMKK